MPMTEEKLQLINKYHKLGGKQPFENLKGLSEPYIERLINTQEMAENSTKNELIDKYLSYWPKDDSEYSRQELESFSHQGISDLVQREESTLDYMQRNKNKVMTSSSESNKSLQHATRRYISINNQSPLSNRSRDNIRMDYNLKMIAKNEGLEQLGITENLEPLQPLSGDIESLLVLNDWNPDAAPVKEYLSKLPLSWQHDYKMEIEDMIRTRDLQIDREKKELRFKKDITATYDKLKKVPKQVVFEDGKPIVNIEFTYWMDQIKQFKNKLINKRKYYEIVANEGGLPINKRKTFFKIYTSIMDLCYKHSIPK